MIRGMRSRHSEMPIPTRSAPKPPGNAISQRNLTWCNNDPFGTVTTSQPLQKKKPPPRPPPPRIKRDNIPSHIEKPKKSTKPTELFTNLFGLKTKTPQVNVTYSNNQYPSVYSVKNNHSNNLLEGTVSLIDLSPPGSPTFTTRSSSDGVSIDSFGSDGNSNPSVFTSSGNTSQTESAFEDDFDFFGNLARRNDMQNDPWKQNNPTFDPFAPLSANSNSTNGIKHVGDASFFAYNNGPTPTFKPTPSTNKVSMPTIIRARPPKPPAPKVLHTSLAPIVPNFKALPAGITQSNGIHSNSKVEDNSTWPTAFDEAFPRNGVDSSPPMPSIPPPAPPAEFLTKLDSSPAQVEPEPQGVALYDFEAVQPGDLSIKQGDIVILKNKINDDWLEGQIDSRIGMFPANFIDIIVPLPDLSSNVVNALYTFNGETWEDLSFEEGAQITILSRISDEWLYGECNGKKGQLPVNYIDRVPKNLPQYS